MDRLIHSILIITLGFLVQACQLPDGTSVGSSSGSGDSGSSDGSGDSSDDDDNSFLFPPTVYFPDAAVSSAETAGTVSITISLNKVHNKEVQVTYTVSGTATNPADHTLASGVATVSIGVRTTTVDLPIVDNGTGEPDETVILTLSSPVNATLGTDTVHTHTIADDDPPVIDFSSASSSVVESLGSTTLTVNLNKTYSSTVTVDYSVTGGTATGGGTDYTLAAGTLTFVADDTSEDITVTLIDDLVSEVDGETVQITLATPSNGTLGSTIVHTLTITDDPIATGLGWFSGTQTTNSTNLNQGTAYAIEWSSSDEDTTYYTHDTATNPHEITIATTGNYFVAFTLPLTGSIARGVIHSEIRVNGTAVEGTVSECSYIRNSNGHIESSNHVATLLNGLNSGDVVTVFVNGSTNIATAMNISNQASLYMEYVSSSRTVFKGRASQTTNGTNLNTSTAYPLQWGEDVESSGFTHSDPVNPHNIQLDQSGDYLTFVNMPFYSTVQRANVRLNVQLDGVTVNGGQAAQAYIRNQNLHNDASSHFSGMLASVSAGAVLTVQTQQEAAGGTVTVQSGQTGSIFVEKVDTTSNVYSARASSLTGGTNWNPTTIQSVEWTNDDIIDSSVFSHSTITNPHQITVLSRGDYLLVYNDYLTSTVQRANPKITVQINGTTLSGAESKAHYIRSSSGHNDSSASLVFLLRDLRANDIITVHSAAEAQTGTVDDSLDALLTLWRKQ